MGDCQFQMLARGAKHALPEQRDPKYIMSPHKQHRILGVLGQAAQQIAKIVRFVLHGAPDVGGRQATQDRRACRLAERLAERLRPAIGVDDF